MPPHPHRDDELPAHRQFLRETDWASLDTPSARPTSCRQRWRAWWTSDYSDAPPF
ncbi:hypothetical protein ABZO31_21960 [Streptomyces sp. HUAS MG47]|uniref:hypothetical protein n=1 Tax=Streptomyces solicamelliae TaxID=3231716 RepID=UPI003877E903